MPKKGNWRGKGNGKGKGIGKEKEKETPDQQGKGNGKGKGKGKEKEKENPDQQGKEQEKETPDQQGKGKEKETPDQQQQQQNAPGCIFPNNVVIKILSFLPAVKSLLRFRSVCKVWLTIISNPNFIALHSSYSSSSLLIQTKYLGDHYRFVLKNPTDAALEEFTVCPHQFFLKPRDLPCEDDVMSVVGVTNGIVCFSAPSWNGGFVLWNPATKQVKCINAMDAVPEQHKTTSLGFGYDPVGNHFMIIKILGFLKESDIPDITHVCPVKTGAWRREDVGLPRFWVNGGKCDTIVNGFPFWRSWIKSGDTFVQRISCFDAMSNLFLHIHMPEDRQEGHIRLVKYETNLGMVAWDDSDSIMNIWLLMRKGWSKKFRLGTMPGVQRVIGFWRGSEVILAKMTGEGKDGGESLTLYNSDTERTRCFRMDGSMPSFL